MATAAEQPLPGLRETSSSTNSTLVRERQATAAATPCCRRHCCDLFEDLLGRLDDRKVAVEMTERVVVTLLRPRSARVPDEQDPIADVRGVARARLDAVVRDD